MITQRYGIGLTPSADSKPPIVYCSQYDTDSRTIEFTLYDHGTQFYLDENDVVTVRGTKKDNTGFEYSCQNNIASVSFAIQEQMTLFAGKTPCELRIVRGAEVLGSMNFILSVEPSPLEESTVISATALPAYESMLLAAQTANYDPPTTDGVYTLAVTVSNGQPTYSWIQFVLD